MVILALVRTMNFCIEWFLCRCQSDNKMFINIRFSTITFMLQVKQVSFSVTPMIRLHRRLCQQLVLISKWKQCFVMTNESNCKFGWAFLILLANANANATNRIVLTLFTGYSWPRTLSNHYNRLLPVSFETCSVTVCIFQSPGECSLRMVQTRRWSTTINPIALKSVININCIRSANVE